MTAARFRELWAKYSPWVGLYGLELQAAKDICEALTALVHSEAMREKAEWQLSSVINQRQVTFLAPDADWIAAAWEHWLGRVP